jgi:uncharacterized protein YjbI with pentapeptide repeats
MATTENNYTGNGTKTSYTFSFPYIKKEDVKVTLDDIGTTAFTINDNTPTQVDFTVAPPDGVAIRIFRETDTTATSSTFFPGSAIRAQDLNANFEQALYIGQEEENKIQDVISGGIADGSVTNTKIADANVTTAKIADANVTTAKIADANVTTAKIADANVTTAKIADANVTTAKIADANVTTAKIADANVTTAKIADANVTTAKIADANVTTAKIADANVTTAKIADANVTTAKIADANVTTAKIANSAVTTAKLDNGAVTTDKLANGAVTTAKLDTSVTNLFNDYLPLAGGTMTGNIVFAPGQTLGTGNGFISNSSATFTGTTGSENADDYTFSIPSNAKRIVINFLRLSRVDSSLRVLGINIGDSQGLWTSGENQVSHGFDISVAAYSTQQTGVVTSTRTLQDTCIPIGFVGGGNSDAYSNSGTLTLFRITDSSNNYFSGTGTTSLAKEGRIDEYANAQSTRNSGKIVVDHVSSSLPVSQFSFIYSNQFNATASYGLNGYVSIDYYSNI